MGKPRPELAHTAEAFPSTRVGLQVLLSSWGAGSVDDGVTAAVSPGAEMSGEAGRAPR